MRTFNLVFHIDQCFCCRCKWVCFHSKLGRSLLTQIFPSCVFPYLTNWKQVLKTETNGFPKGLKGSFCLVLFSSTVIDFIVGESHWVFSRML